MTCWMSHSFDAIAFYFALDSCRKGRAMTWKQVAQRTGVSASTLSRMGRPGIACQKAWAKNISVDGIASLLAWSGLRFEDYVHKLWICHTGDPAEWPEDLRVREFPGDGAC